MKTIWQYHSVLKLVGKGASVKFTFIPIGLEHLLCCIYRILIVEALRNLWACSSSFYKAERRSDENQKYGCARTISEDLQLPFLPFTAYTLTVLCTYSQICYYVFSINSFILNLSQILSWVELSWWDWSLSRTWVDSLNLCLWVELSWVGGIVAWVKVESAHWNFDGELSWNWANRFQLATWVEPTHKKSEMHNSAGHPCSSA